MQEIYKARKLSAGNPELKKLHLEKYTEKLVQQSEDNSEIEKLIKYLNRLVDLREGKKILVIGCGPKPQTVKTLLDRKYNVVAIEPVIAFIDSAKEYLGENNVVVQGVAEDIPLAENSQNLVLLESVLEHVDSPIKTMSEIFRVLAPGGVCYITTTNKYAISLVGENGEFNIKFFNWFPDILKEAFVFHHLHYKPYLANYSVRPAVHWYDYANLCKLGRQAGFAQFYSLLDLLNHDDPSIAKSTIRKILLDRLKFNPWLRALALTQIGGSIIMLKREQEDDSL